MRLAAVSLAVLPALLAFGEQPYAGLTAAEAERLSTEASASFPRAYVSYAEHPRKAEPIETRRSTASSGDAGARAGPGWGGRPARPGDGARHLGHDRVPADESGESFESVPFATIALAPVTPGALLSTAPEPPPEAVTTVTDEFGAFAFVNMPSTERGYAAYVSAPGYAPYVEDWGRSAGADMFVGDLALRRPGDLPG